MGYYVLIHGQEGASFLNERLFNEKMATLERLESLCVSIYDYFTEYGVPLSHDWINVVISGDVRDVRGLISAEVDRCFDLSQAPKYIRSTKRVVGDAIYWDVMPHLWGFHELFHRFASELPGRCEMRFDESGCRIETSAIAKRLMEAYSFRPHYLYGLYRNPDFFEGKIDCYFLLWLLSSYADENGTVEMSLEDLSTQSFLPIGYIVDRLNELEDAHFLKRHLKGSRKHNHVSLSVYEFQIPNHKDYYGEPNNGD